MRPPGNIHLANLLNVLNGHPLAPFNFVYVHVYKQQARIEEILRGMYSYLPL